MSASPIDSTHDAVVIGGGFYGAAIAIYLATQRGLGRVALVERESMLLGRASYNNQARVHNGYHYPRSFTTAYRSRMNMPRFVRDWPDAVTQDFTMLYAIARHNSRVTAKQFERFCRGIGSRLQPVDSSLRALFEPRLVEDVFLVEEYVFDTTKLASWAARELEESGVRIFLKTRATAISVSATPMLQVAIETEAGHQAVLTSRYVFNCTYSGLNQFDGQFHRTRNGLKHEITEMPLVKVPPVLQGLGVTVMDGPFFSMMPFPARGLHTLSHVRYTPHVDWACSKDIDPYMKLDNYQRATRVDRIVRDIGRYLPAVLAAEYVESLYEVKTVLIKNEIDDGRPILFEKHQELTGLYSVLGGKIDNIYDVLEKLDDETF